MSSHIPDEYYDWLKGRDDERDCVVEYLHKAVADLEANPGMVTPAQAVANLASEIADEEHRFGELRKALRGE